MTGRRGIPARPRRPARDAGRLARLLAAGVVLVLAGCGLPGDGPVLVGRAVDENVVPQARIVVPAPAPGAGPEEIVRGFLQAGAAFQETGDRSAPVAASYLAAESVPRWRPLSSVTVFDRSVAPRVEPSEGGSARVTVQAVATVDETGRYRELAPGTVAQAALGVVQEQGEWRVTLPEGGFGLWLSTDDFGRLFEAYRLSYAAVGARRIVADVRWFPLGPRLATALARAQLGPVPDYLKGAAETAIPDGTRLAVDAVSVDGGVATVVLTAPATGTDAGRRAAMWAQFVATLTQVPAVHAVSLEVQGSGRLAVQDVRSPVGAIESLGFSASVTPAAQALARVGTQLVWVDPSRLDEATPAATGPGPSPLPPLPPGVSSLAVSADLGDLAGLSAAGSLVRWRGSTPVPVQAPGSGLLAPAYDARGGLWVGGGEALWTFDATSADSVAEPVEASWLAGRTVLAVAPSPDATRLAVVSAGGDGDGRLDVAGVVRDQAGRPTSLAKPYRQGEPLRRLSSVTWVNELTLAVLGAETPDAALRPYAVDLGQGVGLRRRGAADPRDSLIAPAAGAARLVSTTGGLRGIVAITDDARVKVRSGGGWRVLANASDLLVPPGRPV